MSCKICPNEKLFLKTLQHWQENTCAGISFFMKVQTIDLQLYLKDIPENRQTCGCCKSFKGALSGMRQIFRDWKPFKNDEKKLFISPQKLFSFSRYLVFSLGFLVIWQNDLIRKIRLISNFMMPQPD